MQWLRSRKKKAYAIAELCKAFEPLVAAHSVRYARDTIELEDLEQVARLGVLKACKGYDPKKVPFPVRVLWCVKQELDSYVGSLENPVRLPLALSFRLPKLRRVREQLAKKLERAPTIDELSRATKLSQAAILAMTTYDQGPVCLDAPYDVGNNLGASKHPTSPGHTLVIDHVPSPVLSPEDAMIFLEEHGYRTKGDPDEQLRSSARREHRRRSGGRKTARSRQRNERRRVPPRKASRRGNKAR